MKYILKVDFYTKDNITAPILLYSGDFGSTIEFQTNLLVESMVMQRMSTDFESGWLLIRKPNGSKMEVPVWGSRDIFYAKITTDMTKEVGLYEYQLRINVRGGTVTSSPYKYEVLPELFGSGATAIIDEAIVDEVYVGQDSYTYMTKAGYQKTVWIPHETLISAEKMNKIENQLEILTDSAGSGGGGGTGIQISATEPLDKSVLWVDIADEI